MNNELDFETHYFNEENKRLEYINNKGLVCRYCNINIVNSSADNCFVPIYGVQKRTILIVYNSVNYSKLPVEICRCNSCKLLLEKADTKSFTYAIALTTIMFIVLGTLFHFAGLFFGVFLSIIILIIGKNLFKEQLLNNYGILNELEGAKRETIIKDLMIKGWTLEPPSA